MELVAMWPEPSIREVVSLLCGKVIVIEGRGYVRLLDEFPSLISGFLLDLMCRDVVWSSISTLVVFRVIVLRFCTLQ